MLRLGAACGRSRLGVGALAVKEQKHRLPYITDFSSTPQSWVIPLPNMHALIRGPAHWNPADRVAKRQARSQKIQETRLPRSAKEHGDGDPAHAPAADAADADRGGDPPPRAIRRCSVRGVLEPFQQYSGSPLIPVPCLTVPYAQYSGSP